MPEENQKAPSQRTSVQANIQGLHNFEDLVGRYRLGDDKTRPTIVDAVKRELFNLDRRTVEDLFFGSNAIKNKVDTEFGIDALPNLKIPKQLIADLKTNWKTFSAEYDRYNYEKQLAASEAKGAAISEGGMTAADAAKLAVLGQGFGAIGHELGSLVGIKPIERKTPEKGKPQEKGADKTAAKAEKPSTEAPSTTPGKEELKAASKPEAPEASKEEERIMEEQEPEITVEEPTAEEINEIIQAEAQAEGIQQALGGRINLEKYPTIQKQHQNEEVASGLAALGKQSLEHEKKMGQLNSRLQSAQEKYSSLEGKTHAEDRQQRTEIRSRIRSLQSEIRNADAGWKAKSEKTLQDLEKRAISIQTKAEAPAAAGVAAAAVAGITAPLAVTKAAQLTERLNQLTTEIEQSPDPFTRQGASFYEIRKLKKEVRNELKSNPTPELKLLHEKLDLLGSEFREGQIMSREGKDGRARLMASLQDIKGLTTPEQAESLAVQLEPKNPDVLNSRANELIARAINLSSQIVPGQETPEQFEQRTKIARETVLLDAEIRAELQTSPDNASLKQSQDRIYQVNHAFSYETFGQKDQARMANLSASMEASQRTTIQSTGPGLAATAAGAVGAIAVGIPSPGGINILPKISASQQTSIQSPTPSGPQAGRQGLRMTTNLRTTAEAGLPDTPSATGMSAVAPGLAASTAPVRQGRTRKTPVQPPISRQAPISTVPRTPEDIQAQDTNEPGVLAEAGEQVQEGEGFITPPSIPDIPLQASSPLNLAMGAGTAAAGMPGGLRKIKPRSPVGLPGGFVTAPAAGARQRPGHLNIGPQVVKPPNQLNWATGLQAQKDAAARQQEMELPEDLMETVASGGEMPSGWEAVFGEGDGASMSSADAYGHLFNPMEHQGAYAQAERAPGAMFEEEEEEAGLEGEEESDLQKMEKFRSSQQQAMRSAEQLTGMPLLGGQIQAGKPQGQLQYSGPAKTAPTSNVPSGIVGATEGDRNFQIPLAMRLQSQLMQVRQASVSQTEQIKKIKEDLQKLRKAGQAFKNLLDVGEIAASESVLPIVTLWAEWNIDLINKHIAEERIPFFEKKPTNTLERAWSFAKDFITIAVNFLLAISVLMSFASIFIIVLSILSVLGIFAYFIFS